MNILDTHCISEALQENSRVPNAQMKIHEKIKGTRTKMSSSRATAGPSVQLVRNIQLDGLSDFVLMKIHPAMSTVTCQPAFYSYLTI